jgi:hypothetical protein
MLLRPLFVKQVPLGNKYYTGYVAICMIWKHWSHEVLSYLSGYQASHVRGLVVLAGHDGQQ